MIEIKHISEKDRLIEARKKAREDGTFDTKAGIFDYYFSVEGKSEEEAARLTDIQCRYRPHLDKEPEPLPTTKDKLQEYISLAKENPELTEFLLGGLQALGSAALGFFAGLQKNKDAMMPPPPSHLQNIPPPDMSNVEKPVSLKDLPDEQE